MGDDSGEILISTLNDDSGELLLGSPTDVLGALASTPYGTTVPIPCLSGLTEAERQENGGYAPQEVPSGAPAPRRFVPIQAD